MMISPDGYYELECKGKSYEELLKQAKGIRREIRKCIRDMEEYSEDGPAEYVKPGPDVICQCDFDYLEMVKKAISDQGYEYPMTKAEIKGEEFRKNLDSIKSLTFSIGGFICGRTIHRVDFDDEVIYTREKLFVDEETENELSFEKDRLIDLLKGIRMETWKHRYEDPFVMDGTQWEITIEYYNGIRKGTFTGSNAYPWSFKGFAAIFGEECEEE